MGLSVQQIDSLKNACLLYFKGQNYSVFLDIPISDDIRWRPHIYAKGKDGDFILDILTTEDIPQSQLDKYTDIRNESPDLSIYLAIVGDVSYSYTGVIEKCSRYGIGIYIINDRKLHLLINAKTLTIDQIRSQQDTAIAPDRPFGNILALKKCFRNCKDYLYWLERNLPKKVFELLYDAIKEGDIANVGEIKLLRVYDNTVDDRFKSEVERLRGELVNYDVNLEIRVISDKNIAASLHGRFIYTQKGQFQLPPLNSLLANQWDNIFHDPKIPPFEVYWKHGLDIVTQWEEIQRTVTSQPANNESVKRKKATTA